MKIYSYNKCSTCRKALKYLDSMSIEHEVIDITLNPPTKKELNAMLKVYEGEIKKLFNTSGVQYRELNIKDKLPGMKTSEAIDLLSKNGKLIKRPFLIDEKKGLVGFKEEQWQKALHS